MFQTAPKLRASACRVNSEHIGLQIAREFVIVPHPKTKQAGCLVLAKPVLARLILTGGCLVACAACLLLAVAPMAVRISTPPPPYLLVRPD